jgi:hypothetical protein
MTTINAARHQRLPFLTACAAGAVLAVAGTVGVAWVQADHAPAASTTHSTDTPAWTSTVHPGLSDFTGARRAAQHAQGIQRPGCTGDCVG